MLMIQPGWAARMHGWSPLTVHPIRRMEAMKTQAKPSSSNSCVWLTLFVKVGEDPERGAGLTR